MDFSHILILIIALAIGYTLRGVWPGPAQAIGLP